MFFYSLGITSCFSSCRTFRCLRVELKTTRGMETPLCASNFGGYFIETNICYGDLLINLVYLHKLVLPLCYLMVNTAMWLYNVIKKKLRQTLICLGRLGH